jgi:hypothetical protein
MYISQHCKEQDFEICAIQLVTKISNLIILSLYRAPSGDVNELLRRLDSTLKYLHNPKSDFITCGDKNVNYLNRNSLLKTQNLSQNENFAARIQNTSSITIDNTFVDSTSLSSSCASPRVNGLSDHDAQFLTVNNITEKVNLIHWKHGTRKLNNKTIADFQHRLENEIWEPVFKNKDINYV